MRKTKYLPRDPLQLGWELGSHNHHLAFLPRGLGHWSPHRPGQEVTRGTLDDVGPQMAPSEILIQILIGPGEPWESAKKLLGCTGELLGWGTPSPSPFSHLACAWENPLFSEHISTRLNY